MYLERRGQLFLGRVFISQQLVFGWQTAWKLHPVWLVWRESGQLQFRFLKTLLGTLWLTLCAGGSTLQSIIPREMWIPQVLANSTNNKKNRIFTFFTARVWSRREGNNQTLRHLSVCLFSWRRGYLPWTGRGEGAPTFDWGLRGCLPWTGGGVPTLDRLCRRRYASCGFPQENFLVSP